MWKILSSSDKTATIAETMLLSLAAAIVYNFFLVVLFCGFSEQLGEAASCFELNFSTLVLLAPLFAKTTDFW